MTTVVEPPPFQQSLINSLTFSVILNEVKNPDYFEV